MPNFRDGNLDVGQAFPALARTVLLTADDTAVQIDTQTLLLIGSDSTTATARTFTLGASKVGSGHLLRIVWNTASSFTGQLVDTGTMRLQGDWRPLAGDSLVLIWDGTNWNEVSRSSNNAATNSANGLQNKRLAVGTFDATAGRAVGSYTLDCTIPDKSIVTGTWYEVTTTFTSATDAATIALTIQSAGDITAAIAISNAANPWDAALPVEGITKIETTSTWIKLTANRDLTATVAAAEALTAGVLRVYVEYIPSI
jgi:hypothetical protein